MKVILDNKTECEVLYDNGILAQVKRDDKTIEIFSFRLTYIR